MKEWERPNPSRLNDTSAIVRKGVHPYQLLLRGEEIVGSVGRWTSPLETPWNAENTFPNGRRPSDVGVGPNYGAGPVMVIHTPKRSPPGATPNGLNRSSPAPDKNRAAPGPARGNGGSLKAAVDCIPKGC